MAELPKQLPLSEMRYIQMVKMKEYTKKKDNL